MIVFVKFLRYDTYIVVIQVYILKEIHVEIFRVQCYDVCNLHLNVQRDHANAKCRYVGNCSIFFNFSMVSAFSKLKAGREKKSVMKIYPLICVHKCRRRKSGSLHICVPFSLSFSAWEEAEEAWDGGVTGERGGDSCFVMSVFLNVLK